ncbi:MAG: glutathione S-transferase [Betaproteobacteria bacterium CG2_30_68_42]|nr:MAG: glutathione S-transferase [Betaproteobacteria bacterium CG2_30_68_42]PJA57001.1 MAG: glutathione S-transferase [Rhodocyclales bacterium CG_4_9_14_3_um_filter_68_10]
MKLIGSFTSPYVRKVRIVLAEKKIDYEFVEESPSAPGSRVPLYNPLGKVPVLVLDDESTLFDSRVIVDYLDNSAPNNRLIPTSNRERAQVRRWEALADGVCDAAALIVMESRRPEGERSPAWVERQRGKVLRAVHAMSEELAEQAWYHGPNMSLADIATGVSLGYLAFRFPDIDWRGEYPNLGRLVRKLEQRPSFAETVPPAA